MKKFSYILIFSLFIVTFSFAETIKFGVSSVISAGNTVYLYERLNEYISKKLGQNVEFVSKKNYSEMNELIENAEVDIASVCSGAIAFLKDDSYVLLAIPVVNGKSKYQSYFIVKKDFEYKDLKSLKGKTIAFTDKLSFSGTLYPLYFFKNNDIDIEKYFSNIYFTGSHDKSIYLVSKGVVDIAPVDSLIYEHEKIVSPEVINNTKVIFKSPDFPIPPIIASKKINVRLLNRIKSILINMDKDEKGRKILRQLNIDRFEDGLGYDYSDVIKISREVENYKIINTK
jgi:phosphonate transport system substrate-binding protein